MDGYDRAAVAALDRRRGSSCTASLPPGRSLNLGDDGSEWWNSKCSLEFTVSRNPQVRKTGCDKTRRGSSLQEQDGKSVSTKARSRVRFVY
jgi:hypothetical protein